MSNDRRDPSWLPRSRQAAGTVRDLRGGVRLAFDGVRAGIDQLQLAHQRLAQVQPPVQGMRVGKATSGVGGMLYRGLRGTADLLGGGLDLALASVQAALLDPGRDRGAAEPQPGRETLVAALNAVAGDHLHRTDNPLAIATRLRVRAPTRQGHVIVLVHGLGLSDIHWQQGAHDHGAALADALGGTPVYAQYNSGRRVAAIGRELAAELQAVLGSWPVPLTGVSLVGHGQGGLVLRSALYQAARSGLAWPGHVRKLVFLGTPHHGASPDALALPMAAPLVRAALRPFTSLSRRRSDGLDDFIEGRVLDADARTGLAPENAAAGLLAVGQTYAIGGSLADGRGDGVVPLDSALGRHPVTDRDLLLPEDHRLAVAGVDHLGLLASPDVFQAMRQWLSD